MTKHIAKLYRKELYNHKMISIFHLFHNINWVHIRYQALLEVFRICTKVGGKREIVTQIFVFSFGAYILLGRWREVQLVWSQTATGTPYLWAAAAYFGWLHNSWSRVWTWTKEWRCSLHDMGQCILAQGEACHLSAWDIPSFLLTGYHQRGIRQLKGKKKHGFFCYYFD
jgi:hypothetical protein